MRRRLTGKDSGVKKIIDKMIKSHTFNLCLTVINSIKIINFTFVLINMINKLLRERNERESSTLVNN